MARDIIQVEWFTVGMKFLHLCWDVDCNRGIAQRKQLAGVTGGLIANSLFDKLLFFRIENVVRDWLRFSLLGICGWLRRLMQCWPLFVSLPQSYSCLGLVFLAPAVEWGKHNARRKVQRTYVTEKAETAAFSSSETVNPAIKSSLP